MKVFKLKYKDSNDKSKIADKWYIDFRDHKGRRHKMAAFEDKECTNELGKKITKLVGLLHVGIEPEKELLLWVNSLPHSILNNLVRWGILHKLDVFATEPLDSHLEKFQLHMADKHKGEDYVQRVMYQTKKIIDECGFAVIGDITKQSIEIGLKRLKEHGLSNGTIRSYSVSMNTFLNWSASEGLIANNPFVVNNEFAKTRVSKEFPLKMENAAFVRIQYNSPCELHRYGFMESMRTLIKNNEGDMEFLEGFTVSPDAFLISKSSVLCIEIEDTNPLSFEKLQRYHFIKEGLLGSGYGFTLLATDRYGSVKTEVNLDVFEAVECGVFDSHRDKQIRLFRNKRDFAYHMRVEDDDLECLVARMTGHKLKKEQSA